MLGGFGVGVKRWRRVEGGEETQKQVTHQRVPTPTLIHASEARYTNLSPAPSKRERAITKKKLEKALKDVWATKYGVGGDVDGHGVVP
ncbi:hypothetical protein LTR17_011493 [Elasticomyces elasticus]|nr:hypothetical protein LTR17_011493 [Elasticomyces elasticus]